MDPSRRFGHVAGKQLSGIAAGCLISAASAFAQSPAPARPAGNAIDYEAVRSTKIIRAVRITEKIAIDGSLEESTWSLAPPATGFIRTG